MRVPRAGHRDFSMGGDLSPPIGGGPKGGDKGPMGGDWRVIRDNLSRTLGYGIGFNCNIKRIKKACAGQCKAQTSLS